MSTSQGGSNFACQQHILIAFYEKTRQIHAGGLNAAISGTMWLALPVTECQAGRF